ncbi:mRNA cap guanine-N7 methyltransferase isoform X1 [Harmonia axyridis]|uniref:mRNA cap guanine-N7 methyltransferase isoform X1 n=1 Tax=Harmonia axyridis TaxID=115357 RepID=UPI001E278AD6|nr:mRNA cap guanine-N7 methyltransferase isoform X1 [Harmonia axyridis]
MATTQEEVFDNEDNNFSQENTSTEDLEKALMVAAADAYWTNDSTENNCVQNSSDNEEREKESETNDEDIMNSKANTSLPRRVSKNLEEDTESSKSLFQTNQNNEDEIVKNSSTSLKRNITQINDDEGSSKKIKISDETRSVEPEGYAKLVATHYNQLQEKGVQERNKSRIVYMRNFHNWIKSMLINEYLTNIKASKKYNAPIRALDMGCGKGGDLLKWKKGNISHLICTDIALVSLDQCKNRYSDMKERSAKDRNGGNLFSIEYISADCSRLRLREKYSDPSAKLDIVSCQFAFHYSFESLPQAECMLRNASECLQAGGYFIGTIPDAYELVSRAKRNNSNSFGNDVYQVVFDCDMDKPPLFGAKYNFYLDGVVDCPEFLVYFPMLEKLAKKYGLKLVRKEKFHEFFNRMKNEGNKLLSNMSSLESYPPFHSSNLVGTSEGDYEHAEEFLRQQNRNIKIGTLSKSEWEASSLYLTFAFQKVKNTWNPDGTPCYDI